MGSAFWCTVVLLLFLFPLLSWVSRLLQVFLCSIRLHSLVFPSPLLWSWYLSSFPLWDETAVLLCSSVHWLFVLILIVVLVLFVGYPAFCLNGCNMIPSGAVVYCRSYPEWCASWHSNMPRIHLLKMDQVHAWGQASTHLPYGKQFNCQRCRKLPAGRSLVSPPVEPCCW